MNDKEEYMENRGQKRILDSEDEDFVDSDDDMYELKSRMEIIVNADPTQYPNDQYLWRYLRAYGSCEEAHQALLSTHKWRHDYKVSELNENNPIIQKHMADKKILVMPHRDFKGRPVVYVPARNHNSPYRDIDEITKFVVFCMERACRRCFEEAIDNLCVVFDLKNFTLSCMDFHMLKNLIWLLTKYYPERLGLCLIVNAPNLFAGCWNIISSWLPENTLNKIIFVTSRAMLNQFLPHEIIPM